MAQTRRRSPAAKTAPKTEETTDQSTEQLFDEALQILDQQHAEIRRDLDTAYNQAYAALGRSR